MSIRVLIADDQQLVRSGFRVLLDAEPDIEVVGEAADGVAAVAEARRLRPDIALMDIRMPRLDGIEATRSITNTLPGTRVIILTTYDLDEYVFDALRAGACGFLLKDVRTAELADAVRTVNDGGALLAPTVTLRMISQFARSPSPAQRDRLLAMLTPREGEVLKLIGHGLSNTEIAARLMISQATTKTHVARILLKLGLRDRVQAAVLAYERGVVIVGQDNPRMPPPPPAAPGRDKSVPRTLKGQDASWDAGLVQRRYDRCGATSPERGRLGWSAADRRCCWWSPPL